jgi:hypothetical protein
MPDGHCVEAACEAVACGEGDSETGTVDSDGLAPIEDDSTGGDGLPALGADTDGANAEGGTVAPPPPPGCGCRLGSALAPAAWLVGCGLLGLLLARRRRGGR